MEVQEAVKSLTAGDNNQPIDSGPVVITDKVLMPPPTEANKENPSEVCAINDVQTSSGLYNFQLKVEFTAAGPVVKVIQANKVEVNAEESVIGERGAR